MLAFLDMFAEVKTPRGHRGAYLEMPKWGEREEGNQSDDRMEPAVSDAGKDKTRGTRPTDLSVRGQKGDRASRSRSSDLLRCVI